MAGGEEYCGEVHSTGCWDHRVVDEADQDQSRAAEMPEPSEAEFENDEERRHKAKEFRCGLSAFHWLDASLKPEHTKDTKASQRARWCSVGDGVDCRAMKRVLFSFIISCFLGAVALAQEHKISVQ